MSLGKDLASIRKGQNLTLEDIQNAVKIPQDTLASIENDRIFTDQNINNTYVRSFVRSYAKVLKVDDEDIVKALDEVEAGTYAGSILRDSSQSAEHFTSKKSENEDSKTNEDKASLPKSFTPHSAKDKPFESSEPSTESFEWADLGNKFSSASKSSRIWIIIVAIVVVLGLLGAGYYFWDDFGNNSETEPATEPLPELPDTDNNETVIPPAPVDSTSTGQDASEQNVPQNSQQESNSTQISELGDTLTLSVYAAYGQLEPIRITSDLNWRTNPFWIEEGQAYNFDFRDTLLVRGQYSRLLLLFNGHVVENPRQNYFDIAFNSIMITRDIIDQPEFLAPAPSEFPLQIGAPDSTIFPISF